MRVAIFVDGRNFYSGWRDAAGARRLDFARLARWVTRRAGGDRLWGTFYYTGVDPTGAGDDADPSGRDAQGRSLVAFLDMLERQPGFFVKRLPRRIQRAVCPDCGKESRSAQDKEVDTTLVADLVRYAALGAYDAVVLISGDADYAPAIEAARSFGRQAFVASWGGAGLANRLRREAFDHIDLLDGLSDFGGRERLPEGRPAAARPSPAAAPAADVEAGAGADADLDFVDVGFLDDHEGYDDEDDGDDDGGDDGDDDDREAGAPAGRGRRAPVEAADGAGRGDGGGRAEGRRRAPSPRGGERRGPTEETFLAELDRAAHRFPYVGLNYFLTRWRSPVLDPDPDLRSHLLDDLVDRGRIEIYEAPDGNKAIRLVGGAGGAGPEA